MNTLLFLAVTVPLMIVTPAALLRLSCRIAGVEKRKVPSIGRAILTAALAAIASFIVTAAWGCTFGLLLGLFFSNVVVGALGYCVSVTVTALTYRGLLSLPFGQSVTVAFLAHLLGILVIAVSRSLFGGLI